MSDEKEKNLQGRIIQKVNWRKPREEKSGIENDGRKWKRKRGVRKGGYSEGYLPKE